jgi:hypothetical protein
MTSPIDFDTITCEIETIWWQHRRQMESVGIANFPQNIKFHEFPSSPLLSLSRTRQHPLHRLPYPTFTLTLIKVSTRNIPLIRIICIHCPEKTQATRQNIG